MTEENDPSRHQLSLSNTDLAFERTGLANERTLMAWIRTATSMISFGFTIYKFFQEAIVENDPIERLLSPRIVGMIMISFGFISLLFGLIQHNTMFKKLKRDYSGIQRSISSVLAILILIFGLLLFLAALFRQ